MSTKMTHDEAVKICQTLIPKAGNPPEVGWWMVSYWGNVPKMRWWNGKVWSVYCTQSEAEAKALPFLISIATTLEPEKFHYYPRVWEGKFLARKKG